MNKTVLQQIKKELVTVEGSAFMMGSEKREREQPIHQVRVSTFQIAKYPVIQKIWEAVMGDNPSQFNGENRPVEQVSWDDICEKDGFLEKLNREVAKYTDLFDDGKEFKLPTEAQWEYAARGGKEGVKDNFEFAGSRRLKEVGWNRINSHSETKPVGLKMPNQLGLFDMSGNVWEWCRDWWHESYGHAPKNGDQPWEENGDEKLRMVRGGSWYDFDFICRVAVRYWNYRYSRNLDIGLRLCRY